MRLLEILSDALFGTRLSDPSMLGYELVVHEKDALRHRGLVALDRLIAAGRYDTTAYLKESIRRFKFGHDLTLASPLAALLVQAMRDARATQENVCMVSVPLHASRIRERGYNQSHVLAEKIAQSENIPLVDCLIRTRATGRQALRTRAERLIAMRDAFQVQTECNIPAHIILIDDIATTGATLEACAVALKERGVQTVEAAVIAVG